uniref:Suf domain-containing protein n=1 Tax=Rhabditophanes sp. KR3021 TaxID=114890 RepID=A0AC35THP7_9BILA
MQPGYNNRFFNNFGNVSNYQNNTLQNKRIGANDSRKRKLGQNGKFINNGFGPQKSLSKDGVDFTVDLRKPRLGPLIRHKGKSHHEIKGLVTALIQMKRKFNLNRKLQDDREITPPSKDEDYAWKWNGKLGLGRLHKAVSNEIWMNSVYFLCAPKYYRVRYDQFIEECVKDSNKVKNLNFENQIKSLLREKMVKRRMEIQDNHHRVQNNSDIILNLIPVHVKLTSSEKKTHNLTLKKRLLQKIRSILSVKLNEQHEEKLVKKALMNKSRRFRMKIRPTQSLAKANSMSLEKRIKSNLWDVASWKQLVSEIQENEMTERERGFYACLLKQFPNNAECWKSYIEHELRLGNSELAEKAFQESLPSIRNISYYTFYVEYIKTTKKTLPEFREILANAYEHAISNIGNDYNALPLYKNYIQFLENVEANGPYAENQKVSAIRKQFTKAFQVPMNGIDGLFVEYQQYEKKINGHATDRSERAIAERMKDYNKIKKYMKDYQKLYKGVDLERYSVPRRAQLPDEKKQRALWQRIINFEKKSSMKIEEPVERFKRISFVYEQYLLRFGRHPSLCYQVIMFHLDSFEKMESRCDLLANSEVEIIVDSIYQKIIAGTMKHCLMFHFCFVYYLEERKHYKMVQEYYKLLLNKDNENKFDVNLIYINYMQFTRRCLGAEKYRIVFRQMRSDERCSCLPYIAAANIEFRSLKNKNVAFNIFKHSQDKFGKLSLLEKEWLNLTFKQSNKELIKEQFFNYINLPSISGNDKIEAWEMLYKYVLNHEKGNSIKEIEEKRRESVSKVYKYKTVQNYTDRYSYDGLMPLTPEQCKLGSYHTLVRPIVKKGRDTEEQVSELAVKVVLDPSIRKFRHKKKQAYLNTKNVVIFNPSTAAVVALAKETKKVVNIDRTEGLIMPLLKAWAPFKPEPLKQIQYFERGEYQPPNSIIRLLQSIVKSSQFSGPFINVEDSFRLLETNFTNFQSIHGTRSSLGVINPANDPANKMIAQLIEVKKQFSESVMTSSRNDPENLTSINSIRVKDSNKDGTWNKGDVFKRRLQIKTQLSKYSKL